MFITRSQLGRYSLNQNVATGLKLNKQHVVCLTHFYVFFQQVLNVHRRQQNFRRPPRRRRQRLSVGNYWNPCCCCRRKSTAETPSFETWPELKTYHLRMTPFSHKQTVQLTKSLFSFCHLKTEDFCTSDYSPWRDFWFSSTSYHNYRESRTSKQLKSAIFQNTFILNFYIFSLITITDTMKFLMSLLNKFISRKFYNNV